MTPKEYIENVEMLFRFIIVLIVIGMGIYYWPQFPWIARVVYTIVGGSLGFLFIIVFPIIAQAIFNNEKN
jgi:uncharacterized membrane protein YgaE (UPF0421/DUF939 family)